MKIEDLSNSDLKEIAKINNLKLEDCVCLKNDEYAHINNQKKIYFKCPVSNRKRATFDDTYNDFIGGALFPETETYKLHSRPQSNNRIYLDFRGGTLTNTWWNLDNNNNVKYPVITFKQFDIGSISQNNIRIQQIWKGVAEDYAPFDVDITTDPTTPYNIRCIITNNTSNEIFNNGEYGGVAFLGVWNLYPAAKDCWCFANNSLDMQAAIQTISHEVGHTLGLEHQGTNTLDYYEGFGDWGPIMGASFDYFMSQWAYVPRGQMYTGTNTQPSINQDDLAIINSRLPYITDDYPNTIQLATNTAAITSNSKNTYYGFITRNTDSDFFKIQSGPGNITITGLVSTINPNLNLELTLYDQNYNKISSSTKNNLNSTINYNVLSNGIYYVKVDGMGSTYYTDYGSLGKYKLIFNLQPIINLQTVEITSNKTSMYKGESVLFTIRNSINAPLYWKNTGTSNSTDFLENTKSGTVMINNNIGTFSLTSIDNLIQEIKTIKIELFTDSNYNNKIAETNVTINNNIYTISPNKTSIFESEQVIFNITGTSNRILYWKNIGTSTMSDFNENLNNNITINNNKATLILTSKYRISEKTIQIQLFTDNLYTNKVAQSLIVNINKLNYSIVPRQTRINEGESIIFDIKTNDNVSSLYWTNVGTSIAADFTNNINNGIVSIANKTGILTLQAKNDIRFEGENTIKIQLRKILNQPYIIESNSVIINDTSISRITITSPLNVYEGSKVIFTIKANAENNYKLYWTNNGTTNASDFVENKLNGELIFNNNVATLVLTTKKDNIKERNETIVLNIRRNSITGPIIKTQKVNIIESKPLKILANKNNRIIGQTIERKTITKPVNIKIKKI